MDKVHFKTKNSEGVRISITECTRRKTAGILVGTAQCMACSYCYDVNRAKKYVVCKKNMNRMSQKNTIVQIKKLAVSEAKKIRKHASVARRTQIGVSLIGANCNLLYYQICGHGHYEDSLRLILKCCRFLIEIEGKKIKLIKTPSSVAKLEALISASSKEKGIFTPIAALMETRIENDIVKVYHNHGQIQSFLKDRSKKINLI